MKSRFIAVGAILAILASLCACGTQGNDSEKDYQGLSIKLLEDRAKEVSKCVAAKGYQVHPQADGTVRFDKNDVPDEQTKQANTAILNCFDELGFSATNLSDKQIKKLYQLQLEAQKCLAKLGYTTKQAPTEQTYQDTYRNGPPWNPFAEVTEQKLDQSTYQKIVQDCPDPTAFIDKFK